MSSMRPIFRELLITVLLGFLAVASSTQAAPSPKAPPELRAADKDFAHRRDPARAWSALRLYRELAQGNPGNPELQSRLAMSCYFNGYRLAPTEDQKKKLFSEGVHAASIAVEESPRCAACHFWLAIDTVLLKKLQGTFSLLGALPRIREHLANSIALDPGYAYGAAYRLLGILDDKVPGIFGGSRERAKSNFERAIAVAPNDPLNYLLLAKLYEDSLDDPARALEIARKGALLPAVSSERVESVEAAEALRKMTERLSPLHASVQP